MIPSDRGIAVLWLLVVTMLMQLLPFSIHVLYFVSSLTTVLLICARAVLRLQHHGLPLHINNVLGGMPCVDVTDTEVSNQGTTQSVLISPLPTHTASHHKCAHLTRTGGRCKQKKICQHCNSCRNHHRQLKCEHPLVESTSQSQQTNRSSKRIRTGYPSPMESDFVMDTPECIQPRASPSHSTLSRDILSTIRNFFNAGTIPAVRVRSEIVAETIEKWGRGSASLPDVDKWNLNRMTSFLNRVSEGTADLLAPGQSQFLLGLSELRRENSRLSRIISSVTNFLENTDPLSSEYRTALAAVTQDSTVDDICELYGVSQQAASRAKNDHHHIISKKSGKLQQ